MTGLQRGANSAAEPLSKLKNASTSAENAVGKVKNSTGQFNTALGKLKTSATQSGDGIGKIKAAATNADGGLGKARTGSDKLKTALDKLKGAAKGAHGELKNVKSQADAVEKSVGKAGKNADAGGKSMGSLGKGLKGASVAQKGLNLAMSANPFGLIMTLLAPLILQFVNMDKVGKLLTKGLTSAWKGITSGAKSARDMLVPLLKGLANAYTLLPRTLIDVLNMSISALNRLKISIPDWVPVWGGRQFALNIPRIPNIPKLAEGGVVRARTGGTLALVGEAGEHEAVIPLNKLERMMGSGSGTHRLAAAVEALAARPVVVQVDSQEIARAVFLGQRQLARR
ncbi:hypothetical protein [Streptomyces sp. NBC_00038]|uniref:hypothetical protein n=1 Tax=Streptomyces sp. NBC_00038 TaxID=2903615 RepID=UPI00224F17DA|nr:hypothetical protein [Streptomyces sp. NBC_00038]MCX5559988.1 hypothetical protein [Streptomyces sp. NBC_00038]